MSIDPNTHYYTLSPTEKKEWSHTSRDSIRIARLQAINNKKTRIVIQDVKGEEIMSVGVNK